MICFCLLQLCSIWLEDFFYCKSGKVLFSCCFAVLFYSSSFLLFLCSSGLSSSIKNGTLAAFSKKIKTTADVRYGFPHTPGSHWCWTNLLLQPQRPLRDIPLGPHPPSYAFVAAAAAGEDDGAAKAVASAKPLDGMPGVGPSGGDAELRTAVATPITPALNWTISQTLNRGWRGGFTHFPLWDWMLDIFPECLSGFGVTWGGRSQAWCVSAGPVESRNQVPLTV